MAAVATSRSLCATRSEQRLPQRPPKRAQAGGKSGKSVCAHLEPVELARRYPQHADGLLSDALLEQVLARQEADHLRVFRRALVSVLPEHVASQIQIHSDFTNLFRSIARDSLPVQVGGDAPLSDCMACQAARSPRSFFCKRMPRGGWGKFTRP